MSGLVICSLAEKCQSKRCRFRWTTDPTHRDSRTSFWIKCVRQKNYVSKIVCEDSINKGFEIRGDERPMVIKYEPHRT